MKNFILECKKCDLYKTRTNPVCFRGNIDSKIMFIGEAPGKEEDEQGLPFVGRSGKLLNKLLVALNITDFYITNIVKCRPPNNRTPLYYEIKACEEFLKKEIEMVNPEIIITLGKTSGLWINNYNEFEWFKYNEEKKWFPVYHPSYLLRNNKMTKVWLEETKKILEKLCLF